MEEWSNINISISIIDVEEHTAALCIPPKQSRKKERHDVRRSNNLRMGTTERFFVWFTRLRLQFQQGPTSFIQLIWTENWEQTDHRYISTPLTDKFIHLESRTQPQIPQDMHLLQNQQYRV
ncbi:MAG: hypothetical protein EZS28_033529 [Streblomastix strix]|uniref:Uncharacterized protein n=1 Tax=Streblomastix strix TaxID=222440 RepID=A0A5J4UMH0_9EUKA|nr:MAG: hypothetical protein EZS28_033529 [Streblomastix strix]